MSEDPHPRPWRIGRKVGRTIYDANDNLIGVMDTVFAARRLVVAVNWMERTSPPPAVMNAPGGPICGCGQPSTWQSGWCGVPCIFDPEATVQP